MPVNVHRPDPEHPKGMGWLMGVGFVDPRPGNHPNQPMALTQSWEPTSELWWELGMRWHPELATKWAVGGGQFEVAEIRSEKPEDDELTPEEGAEEVLEYIGREHPEHAEMLRKIKACGTAEERAKLARKYNTEIKKLMKLTRYISEE